MRHLVVPPGTKESKWQNAILRFLNARVSPPSWMLAVSSTGLAYIALFLLVFGPTGLGTFGAALPFAGFLWAPILVISNTAVLLGFILIKRPQLLKWGAFGSFLMWMLGFFAFMSSGQAITAFIVATPWILFFAYVYLASFFREQTGI